MDLHDLTTVLNADGPFVTVLVDSESDVEQAADEYELQWRGIVRELQDRGVDAPTVEAVAAAKGEHGEGDGRLVVATGRELTGLGGAEPQEGPLLDVLVRAAVGTGADVQLVPGETEQAPDMGLGAVLRCADSLGTHAAARA